MLATPPSFQPLLAPVDAPQVLTFAFRGHEVMVHEHDLVLPDRAAIDALGLEPQRIVPVGLLGDAYCRAAWLARDARAPEGFGFRSLRSFFGRMDEALLAVAGRAYQIADWSRSHQYCGVCAAAMTRLDGERAMKCACGHVSYPRIAPAMMVLVKRGPQLLLGHRVDAPPGRYTTFAGFLEAGESVEEAVHREVHEEVGVRVKDLRYFASQSWPIGGSLMLAFTAEYAGGDIVCDRTEISEARWFGPGDALPDFPPKESVARALIEANLWRPGSPSGRT